MIKEYKLSLSEDLINPDAFAYFMKIGENQYNKFKSKIDNGLTPYYSDGKLDGTKLSKDCFPVFSADIFISHSHDDKKLALFLAGLLKTKYGLSCFLDETVWERADILQKAIDKEFCVSGNKTYDYGLRNLSTSYVHMMLSNALMKTIYQSKIFVFLNTPNTILPRKCITKKSQTVSPWIFFELSVLNIVKREIPTGQINMSESAEAFDITFDLDICDIPELDFAKLVKMSDEIKTRQEGLDYFLRKSSIL